MDQLSKFEEEKMKEVNKPEGWNIVLLNGVYHR